MVKVSRTGLREKRAVKREGEPDEEQDVPGPQKLDEEDADEKSSTSGSKCVIAEQGRQKLAKK